jgi:Holliday junction resolvase RusA-like endonuclease
MTPDGHVYNPTSADAWKAEVQAKFAQLRKETITGPVRLRVKFYLPKPAALRKKAGDIPHISKPDADNLLKAVMDALTRARIYKDDCLVFWPEVKKVYADGESGAEIIIEEIEQ